MSQLVHVFSAFIILIWSFKLWTLIVRQNPQLSALTSDKWKFIKGIKNVDSDNENEMLG